MPLSSAFENHQWIERTRRVRQNPIAAWGFAAAAVAVATTIRWAVLEYSMEGTPFITYYPAIILATLFGGLWPGLSAVVASAILAALLFIPPAFSVALTSQEAVSLSLFVLISLVNVFIIVLLNAAIERMIAQEQNVRVLLESAPNGVVVVDDGGFIKLVNASAEKLFGYERTELIGKSVDVLVPGPKVETHRNVRELFLKKPETRAMGVGRDLSGRRKDGSEFPVEVGLNPVGSSSNQAVLATVIDITERKRAQDSQRMIVRELQHRTRNLFSVFQAIAERTVDESKTAAEIKFVLNGRIQALARAYSMLADAAWEGVSLATILNRQFSGFSSRINVAGCDIFIGPSAAQQFVLIAHELATNALKYGALSTATGAVSIEGKIDRANGQLFSFIWNETGGPQVKTPTRKGFGSMILVDAAKQFAERVVLDYAPRGLHYEIQLPLSAIEATISGAHGAKPAQA